MFVFAEKMDVKIFELTQCHIMMLVDAIQQYQWSKTGFPNL